MGVIPSRFVQDLQVIVDEDAALVCFIHCRGVLKIPPVRIGERQPCFSATWATVNPRAKSAFIRFGNVAIFNKWLWMDA
ncbi:MAG: hypothetical protein K9L30_18980 [Desulfobacterales bacterium]|nr:hypothetical protein [Desulfobacterales bacterium]